MTKQEIIKEKWIEIIGVDNFENLIIDEQGFSDYKCLAFVPNTAHPHGKMQFLNSQLKKGKRTNSGMDFIYIPITLNGLDNNNGWIKIENESDLPKETGKYWVIIKGYTYPTIENKHPDDDCYWISQFSHYQKLPKPNMPIF